MRGHIAFVMTACALGLGPAGAQQPDAARIGYLLPNADPLHAESQHREAVLYTVELPNANFRVILAVAKPGGRMGEIRDHGYPGPSVAFLIGPELWHPLDDELLRTFDNATSWSLPTCSFYAQGKKNWQRTPVAIYAIPKERPFPVLRR